MESDRGGQNGGSGGGDLGMRRDKKGRRSRWEIDATVMRSSEERSGSCGERRVSGDSGREEARLRITEAYLNREVLTKGKRKRRKGGIRGEKIGAGTVQRREDVVVVEDDDSEGGEEARVEKDIEMEDTSNKGVKREIGSNETIDKEEEGLESSSSGVLSMAEGGRDLMTRKERRLKKAMREVKRLEEGVGIIGDPMEGVMKANRLAKKLLNAVDKTGREEEVEIFRRVLDVTGEYMMEIGLKLGRLEGEVGVWRSKAEEKVKKRDREIERRSLRDELEGMQIEAGNSGNRMVYMVGSSGEEQFEGVEISCTGTGTGSEIDEVGERESCEVLDMSPGEDGDLETREGRTEESGEGSEQAQDDVRNSKKVKRMGRPKLIIYDVRKDVEEVNAVKDIYEEWKDVWDKELFLRNFKVVTRKQGGIIAGVERVNWLVEVSGEIQNRLVERRTVRIGEENLRCKEYKDIARCFKCQRFGHVARICRMKVACGRCAGEHDSKGCRSVGRHECVNCRRKGTRGYHKTNSCSCPVLRSETEKYLERLDREMK